MIHLLAAIDPIAAVIGIAGALAGLLGGYAAIQARHTEAKSVGRQEFEGVITAQKGLIDQYRVRIDDLEEQLTTVKTDVAAMQGRCSDIEEEAKKLAKEKNELQQQLRTAEALLEEMRRQRGT